MSDIGFCGSRNATESDVCVPAPDSFFGISGSSSFLGMLRLLRKIKRDLAHSISLMERFLVAADYDPCTTDEIIRLATKTYISIPPSGHTGKLSLFSFIVVYSTVSWPSPV